MRPIWSRSEANQLLVQAELLPVCVRGRRPRLRKRGRTGSSPLEGCKSAARRTAPSSGPCFLSRFMPTVTPTPCRVPGQFRRRKSAVKVHTLVDLRGTIPPSDYVIPQRGTRCTTSTSWTSCSPNPRPSICWIGARHFASLYVLKQGCAFFSHARQAEHAIPPTGLATRRWLYRAALRSDHSAHRTENGAPPIPNRWLVCFALFAL